MGTIKADTVTGLADPNKATIPNTITMGSTTATLNFGNTAIENASAGSTTITGEGGSNTTNIQQGLLKCFINQSNGSSTRDSFNVASLTDVGTGDYRPAFTNHFANNDYVVSSLSSTLGIAITVPFVSAESDYSTGSCEMMTLFVSNTDGGGTSRDSDLVNHLYCGDLA